MVNCQKPALALSISVAMSLPFSAYATNGMLLEGYGADATAMGGAATAVDVGVANMANNPANMMLMEDNTSSVAFSLGNLRPNVNTTVPNAAEAKSDGTSYITPALGYTKRSGFVSYGVGVQARGGMGTEYAADTAIGMAAGSEGARSEMGIGTVIFPVAYQVNQRLNVGATLEYTWAGLDMVMGMPIMNNVSGNPMPSAGSFADFSSAFGGSNVLGSASGSLLNSMAPSIGGMTPAQLMGSSAVFDFSNNNDFTGEANTTAQTGKLGFSYAVSPRFRVGMSHRFKTNLKDMQGSGNMRFVDMASGANLPNMNIPGQYTINGIDVPAITNLGVAYQLSPATMFVADYSLIDWSNAMSNINIGFVADANTPGLGGQSVDVTLKQNWQDQQVLKLGVAHKVNNRLTLRGGVNLTDNPIPDDFLNPLLPATIKNHLTLGFSYDMNPRNTLSASLVFAPEVKQTNSNTGVTVTHEQTNAQLTYTRRF